MPIRLFEALCLATVALTLAVMSRSRAWAVLMREYCALAIAGFIGEETMILLYRFYVYAPSWDARVLDVPVCVPLIWPLVVLSARDVVSSLARRSHRLSSVTARAALVGAFVAFDASLVEVVAVRAGLWSWAEPGHLGVPLIGILGWGFFAFGASFPLIAAADRANERPSFGEPSFATLLTCVLAGPIVAHVLVQASWWGLFRWTLRGDLGSTPLRILAFGALPLALAVLARRSGFGMPIGVAAPRIVAALLFAALLVTSAGADPALLASATIVALPYCWLTRWSRSYVSQHPDRELC